MDITHISGGQPEASLPLQRFLPPLEPGAVTQLVQSEELTGKLVIDPYGSSPRLVAEAARAGCAVLAGVNNPITRFALRAALRPFDLEDLRAALAALAATEKDDQRLEDFLLDLYKTECSGCGAAVHAEYFVWSAADRELTLKAFACPHCNHAGEEPVSALDRERADSFGARGLQRAMALESIAPAGDPDRAHAEAALAVYPLRSLFVVVTLVNKLDQLELHGRQAEALRALLLTAFDGADSMWAHPEGRPRPKQLTASPEFREANLWRALERGVDAWARPAEQVRIHDWPATDLPAPGEVGLFPGAVREFMETLPGLEPAAILTVPPRPNQAYWTLSALWTSWLWGREAAQGIRAALRRRRYDWSWHAAALRQTFVHVIETLPEATRVHALIPECEPGYLASCLAGWDGAGWQVEGRALRVDDRQARLSGRLESEASAGGAGVDRLEAALRGAVKTCLEQVGEPARYASVQAAAACAWARRRGFGRLWRRGEEPSLARFQRGLESVLADREHFVRLDQRRELESGVFWLSDPEPAGERLADRVERRVVAALRRSARWTWLALDRDVCRALPGLQTPDRGLVRAAADSYAVEGDSGELGLRPEDEEQARTRDLVEIRQLLRDIGARLDFVTSGQDPIIWSGDGARYSFSVLETAILSQGADPEAVEGLIYVIPGGRAALLAEKARRDPRLQARLEAGQMVVKFRHVRRLASDTTLTRANLLERLRLDPPEHQDPQLPLL